MPTKKKSVKRRVEQKKAKNKYLAAALNILPGLGYLYLHKRTTFGWILVVGQITAGLGGFMSGVQGQAPPMDLSWMVMAGGVLTHAAFVYDAYSLAQK